MIRRLPRLVAVTEEMMAPTQSATEILDDAKRLWREQKHHDALQLCDQASMQGEDARYNAALLRGDILLEMGDAAGALSTYEGIADPDVPDAEIDCARGIALFELGRFAEAQYALRSAVRGNPEQADAYYALGLLAEIRGRGDEESYFRCAKRLAPEKFSEPPRLTRAEFEEALEEAVDKLPESERKALAQLHVIISELPSVDDVAKTSCSPLSFGKYVGEESPRKSRPPRMLLFKRNLERASTDRHALIEEIHDVIRFEVQTLGKTPTPLRFNN